MLKCQFHTHSGQDPKDKIPYSEKDLISRAAKLGYDVLAITCHNKIAYNKNLRKFAEKKGILLISGVELTIQKTHNLILNPTEEILEVETFDDLREYKKHHPECLIIAPHPFFPTSKALKKNLIENIDIFDAIEYSFCYTKTKNYNDEAVALAKRWKKPIVATADCHILKYLNHGFAEVNAEKSITSIFKAIKQNRIKNHTQPISYFTIFKILFKMIFQM
jgi:predicted metal-dependent phosphoesterase TrpH